VFALVLIVIYKGLVHGVSESQLLLSFVKPHGAVKSATVSRWLTEILSKSRIDIKKKRISAHSTRTVSSSKAKSCGDFEERLLL